MRIPRWRRVWRNHRLLYPLSPTNRLGRSRGRPGPARLTWPRFSKSSATVASCRSGGDPVLCAQDIPISVAVDEVIVVQDEATMLVRELFAGNPQPKTLTVSLVHDAQWIIDDIVCEVTPETVAELLYNEFITFMRYDMERGIDRTPIADWSPYPWPQYMGEDVLNDVLAQYRSGEALPADPFLCAQDVPARVDAERVETSGTENVSLRIAGAYTSGPETYTTYGLALVEMALSPTGEWQMVTLTCEP